MNIISQKKAAWVDERTSAVSAMLDNPDSNGIYQTSALYSRLDKFVFDIIENSPISFGKRMDLAADLTNKFMLTHAQACEIIDHILGPTP